MGVDMRVKTETRREAILEVAAQVFQELGYERTSMDEIAARMGGSKVTLYGYFASKQQLFLEVANHLGAKQLGPAYDELVVDSDDMSRVLRRFGEKFLSFICTPQAAGTYRMVISQSGQSDIGRAFFELGPKRGEEAIAIFLQSQMDIGRLKKTDASVAAKHLLGLLSAETFDRILLGVMASPTRQQLKQIVDRAVKVFTVAYAV